MPTTVPGLALILRTETSQVLKVELVDLPNRESRLRPLLEQARESYDFILIDSPPSLGLLTLNALVAADDVLVPAHV